ncbi:MAG: RHS repeat-associated core domain-containing protein [Caldilineaceae bacterium]
MLQWHDGSSWHHRAYWGTNSVTFGTDNTNGRRPMGNLPPTGQWVKLEVPAALVGLEGVVVKGMAFTLFNGKATWDKAGKRNGTNSTFTYDANGQRVKGVVNGVTTVYINGVYEYQAGATTQYYEGNALRRTGYETNNGVFYLLQDHLKSSSTIVPQNINFGTTERNYYLPFGGNRAAPTGFSALTTKRFTGQYHEASLPGGEGLSYYGARWYDAKLGRFLSADSVVPGPGNPQAFNRYSYVKNRPLIAVDPTGHYDVTPGDDPYWNNMSSSSSASVVTCAGTGCVGANNGGYAVPPGEGWEPLYTDPRGPYSTYTGNSSAPSDPIISTGSFGWNDVALMFLPLAHGLTKEYWGCIYDNCSMSTTNWTGSVDFGGLWAPTGAAARGTASIVFDHQGGMGLMMSAGGGGSTPTVNFGLGGTVTNAPNIDSLKGDSIQIGGSGGEGVGAFVEGVFFKDSETAQQYYGLSASAVGQFPPLVPGSIHSTYEHSWVAGTNLIDAFYYSLEWLLSEGK